MNDYLFNEWMILEIRASYTEVQYVHPFHDCVVERIQKPRGVGNLERNSNCIIELIFSYKVRKVLLAYIEQKLVILIEYRLRQNFCRT